MSSSLLRKAVDKSEAIDSALKWSLLERVNDCVKELQLKCTAERSNTLSNDEATNSFLWVLEAIFIHGLNNSLLKSSMSPFSSLLSSFTTSASGSSGRDASPAVPNPSFWEFVLVFLHRDIIHQINSLHLIHTDVGRCRAWLRIALNDGLLQSFLENMTLKSNRRCLKAFYRTSAFLRDTEKCDIFKNYLMGIELLQFRLVINNSFLNHWNSGPLSLVGLWVDENESITQGVDVANNIESKEFQAIPKLHQRQNSASSTPPRFYSELDSVLKRQPAPLLSEDDALRIILSSSPRSPQTPAQPASTAKTPKSEPRPKSSSSAAASKTNQSTPSKRNANFNSSLPPTGRPTSSDACSSSVQNSERKEDSDTSTSRQGEQQSNKNVTPRQQEGDSVISPTVSNVNSENKATNSSSENDDAAKDTGVELKVTLASPPISPPDTSSTSAIMSSSPAVLGAGVPSVPPQFSTSVSSIEPESPTPSTPAEEERSYADLLLNYQQRTQQSVISEMAIDEETSQNEEEERNHKKSSTGSMNTTTASTSSVKTKKSSKSGVSSSGSKRAYQTSHYSFEQLSELLQLLRKFSESKEDSMELLPRISKFAKVLANEIGLDSQNYACQMCSTSIGMIYGEARLCHFTGALYCSSCHLNQEKVIPARILLNWDFGLYPVCKEAHDFLENLKDEPMFDVQEINSTIYSEIDEFKQTKALRTKLFYIGMYLKTCKNSKAFEQLKKEITNLGNKEHLLDSIHIYSLSELLGIPNRTLITSLTKFVSTGSGHILSCTICREKGFICEVCRKPQVIFPFELERIFKCGGCGAVYHNNCMDFTKTCPRCERWKKNEIPLSSSEKDENENEDT